MRYVPSGLHETLFALPLGMDVTARLSPPSAGTAKMFRNDDLPLMPTYATHLPSGDQAIPRSDRVRYPFANERSCFDARSRTRSSFPSRTNATSLPSGETRTAVSPSAVFVSCVSLFDVKS